MPCLCPNLCFWRKGRNIASIENDTSQQTENNAQPPVHQQRSTLPLAPEPTSEAKQEPQIPSIPEGLPSQVEDTLGECPRFRILLVGKSGVGKSSLIAEIFNLDKEKVKIMLAGNAEIEYGYTSPENPRFILHDSKGFEAGSGDNWTKVEKFLEQSRKSNLLDKVHAIWWSRSFYFSSHCWRRPLYV
ncbi:hypothetical protein CVT25_013877 [Psilocybe cyanescens]|uniref:G domain-containing protein n=1 Tax=Psilocybe cyanescens TaxID=93625 RepID=A0A409WTN2_PSICY|nr:hypothetical protein CVT25_013877 [Psilocybe cyanescens]